MTWDLPVILSTVLGGGGGIGGVVMALRARSESRKTNADAAAVLSGSAAQYAADVTKDAAEARAEAAKARRDIARLSGRVDELHVFVVRVGTCAGGSPCPLRPLVPLAALEDA